MRLCRSRERRRPRSNSSQVGWFDGEPARAKWAHPSGRHPTRLGDCECGGGAAGGFLFLIRDFTPRGYRALPTGKPTTDKYLGVSKVILGVHDLDAAIALYRRAYSLPEPHRHRDPEFDASLAYFDGTPIILAQGLSAASWISRRVAEFGDAPCAFVLLAKGGIGAERASQWFGSYIEWFDSERLGWRLGVEPSK